MLLICKREQKKKELAELCTYLVSHFWTYTCTEVEEGGGSGGARSVGHPSVNIHIYPVYIHHGVEVECVMPKPHRRLKSKNRREMDKSVELTRNNAVKP